MTDADLLGDRVSSRRGMGSHQSRRMGKDEWLTPPWLLLHLGDFDLDPCAPETRPWRMAAAHYTVAHDGLNQPWHGRVWLNPPYGKETAKWLRRLADHGRGIALIFARTETTGFFDAVWGRADAALFIRGRLHFHHTDGSRAAANAGTPSVLVAYGRDEAIRLRDSGIAGQFIQWLPPAQSVGSENNGENDA